EQLARIFHKIHLFCASASTAGAAVPIAVTVTSAAATPGALIARDVLFIRLLAVYVAVAVLAAAASFHPRLLVGHDAQKVADELDHVAGVAGLTLRVLQSGHRPLIDLLLLRTPEPPSRFPCERPQPDYAPLHQQLNQLRGALQPHFTLIGQSDLMCKMR
ncbi:hypothetical protein CC80DRAFT_553517, partial [Byssothecium circinans]